MAAEQAPSRVWDALMEAGRAFDITPAGMLALDVARIEAGLILHRRRLHERQEGAHPVAEVHALRDRPRPAGEPARRAASSARRRCAREAQGGAPRASSSASRSTGTTSSALYEQAGLAPQLPATASRVAVPVYRDGEQVGRASSTTWSPTLKKMIALATVARDAARPGTALQMEMTVDHRRREVGVTVAKLPFFDPPRKRS